MRNPLTVNYFYDFGGTLTDDDEGNLTTLCEDCAAGRDDVQFAQRGEDDELCECVCCGKHN
jgi:hypothetical protein